MWTYRANLTRIVDGDTFDLDIDLGLDIWKRRERVRLYGIDAPERYTDAGRAAIAFLERLFPPMCVNQVIVQTIRGTTANPEAREKYGRYLARISPVNQNDADRGWDDLATLLIREGHGQPYYGGARTPTG